MTTEQSYPSNFRAGDVQRLIQQLNDNNSVTLIGMKRVGINNFLRFLFQHPDVLKHQLKNYDKRLFIHVDLNDLIERDLFPFWTLTLKRIIDTVEKQQLPQSIQELSQKLFSESIQLKDLFVTVDSVRKLLTEIVTEGYSITIIFNRFDRIQEAATAAFFENLQSLKDHANRQLSYIFTSYRSLNELRPDVFTKQALSVFCTDLYLKPSNPEDSSTILTTFEDRFELQLTGALRDEFIQVTGGHVQFIHLSIIKLKESTTLPATREDLIEYLLQNEEALLQSEELLDSLNEKERSILTQLATEDKPETILTETPYLTDTGMVLIRESKPVVFSPLLRRAILRRETQKTNGNGKDFTKKEHLLFQYLQQHVNELCEREQIIEAVWPEYAESGVSDWAVDRLVARVRQKLKVQESPFEIQTVITRGYKLIERV